MSPQLRNWLAELPARIGKRAQLARPSRTGRRRAPARSLRRRRSCRRRPRPRSARRAARAPGSSPGRAARGASARSRRRASRPARRTSRPWRRPGTRSRRWRTSSAKVLQLGVAEAVGRQRVDRAVDVAELVVEERADCTPGGSVPRMSPIFLRTVVPDVRPPPSAATSRLHLEDDQRLAGLGVAADLVGVRRLLQRASRACRSPARPPAARVAPGQKARTTIARKVNGGSSSWPSWKYAAKPSTISTTIR